MKKKEVEVVACWKVKWDLRVSASQFCILGPDRPHRNKLGILGRILACIFSQFLPRIDFFLGM